MAAKKVDPFFLIIMGAATAIGLPFALAFPRTLPEKLAAVVVLLLVAAAVAAAVMALKKKS